MQHDKRIVSKNYLNKFCSDNQGRPKQLHEKASPEGSQ